MTDDVTNQNCQRNFKTTIAPQLHASRGVKTIEECNIAAIYRSRTCGSKEIRVYSHSIRGKDDIKKHEVVFSTG